MRPLPDERIEHMTKCELDDWKKKTAIHNIEQMLYSLDDEYLKIVEVFVRSLSENRYSKYNSL